MSQLPIRVLIVDDDFMVAKVHAGFVAALEGFAVVGTAATGAQALEEIERLRPDLVLLDVQLPDLDGFDVAARLATGDGPMVVLTSSRDFSSSDPQVRRSGARGFVAKDELLSNDLDPYLGKGDWDG